MFLGDNEYLYMGFFLKEHHRVKEKSNKHILIREVNYKITINNALIYET